VQKYWVFSQNHSTSKPVIFIKIFAKNSEKAKESESRTRFAQYPGYTMHRTGVSQVRPASTFHMARGHGRRKDFFAGAIIVGFSRGPKVVKFHFTHSNLRKPFCYNYQENVKFQNPEEG